MGEIELDAKIVEEQKKELQNLNIDFPSSFIKPFTFHTFTAH